MADSSEHDPPPANRAAALEPVAGAVATSRSQGPVVLLAALASLIVPGLGHAMTRRRGGALAWAIGAFAVLELSAVSVWMLHLAFLVRVACAIDAARVLRRDAAIARWLGNLQAIVLVVAGVSLGIARVTLEMHSVLSSSMYPTIRAGDLVLSEELSIKWRPIARGEPIFFRYPCRPEAIFVKRAIALAGDTVEVRCNHVFVNGHMLDEELLDSAVSYEDRISPDHPGATQVANIYRETIDGRSYRIARDVARATDESPVSGGQTDFPAAGLPPPSCRATDFFDGSRTAPQPVGKVVQKSATAGACEPQRQFVVPEHSLFVLGDNRDHSIDSRTFGVVPEDLVLGRIVGIVYTENGDDRSFARTGALH